MKIIFFPTGNTAVFDEDGKQIPELQTSWLKMFIAFLRAKDIDVTKIEFTMPNGTIFHYFPDLENEGYETPYQIRALLGI